MKKTDKIWYDTKLTEEEMNFLWQIISKKTKQPTHLDSQENISKSELIIDKDNWFFNSALKRLTEKMFYRDWDNYYKYRIEKEEPPPKFEMYSMWVNYQKQHEIFPMHEHTYLYSFVVFMKIPTHWKEQHALPLFVNHHFFPELGYPPVPCASDFAFVRSEKDKEKCTTINFPLSPEDEGRMLFFPSTLQHMVYPFYECEEERITISGNIRLDNPNRSTSAEVDLDVKDNILKMMKIITGSYKIDDR